jgi:hypothetical protein
MSDTYDTLLRSSFASDSNSNSSAGSHIAVSANQYILTDSPEGLSQASDSNGNSAEVITTSSRPDGSAEFCSSVGHGRLSKDNRFDSTKQNDFAIVTEVDRNSSKSF